jgi:hypothetical protein
MNEKTFMIFSHSNSSRAEVNLRLTLAALALLLTVMFGARVWAQDDAPVIISDGSLTFQSAVKWSNYSSPDANTKVHPDSGRTVTRVAITMPGHNQTIPFSNQKCTVTVTYNSQDFVFTTGGNGKGLRVTGPLDSLQRGASDNQLVHRITNRKISRVVVAQGNQTVFDNTATGGTQIVISYR